MTDILEEAESDMLNSELWKTLFRGGYNVKKLQRSLSGRQVRVMSHTDAHRHNHTKTHMHALFKVTSCFDSMDNDNMYRH